ncbi:unnamed protein product [Plutella xylostella]|uniref:(diamondback moth) hypothetical protein n=1 Tax=Plutella xylostella TaxID=51655 RepID=A0A8S4G7P9_PLUXY|nr:unnamed protein product [Plutella xylostella]
MTAGKETMGEQPIFTCKAHVFHIDPKTKRSWMSASAAAVSVSFFYDSSRNLYRIISVEGTKAVINSTITGNMTFTKTSQKFGQWSDVRANTVYGLGFASEAELGKFIEKFQEVKDAIGSGACAGKTNGNSGAATPLASATASPLLAARATEENVPAPTMQTNGNSGAATPLASATASPLLAARATEENVPAPTMQSQIKQENEDMGVHQRAHSVSSSTMQSGYATVGRSPRAPPPPETDNSEQLLRHENDRLKLALAQRLVLSSGWLK